MTKECTKCTIVYPIEMFGKQGSGTKRTCKKCNKRYAKAYRINNKEKIAEYNSIRSLFIKEANIKRYYNITTEEYNKCMNTSDRCELCGTTSSLCYDHDHNTMKFRGVLCISCNGALGRLGDTKEGLEKALRYLNK